VAVVFAMEDLGSVGEDLSGIEVLYGLGVRCAGLAYNPGSALGMLIDFSHVGDRTALEATAASERPVVITHAGARELWHTRRMKPDDVLRACAETGGVIGIEAALNITHVNGMENPGETHRGIITDGGQAVNVVPAYAAAKFQVRALTSDGALELLDRVEECARAAAAATGTTVTMRRGLFLRRA
jgi:microsomal dipeptidase-like Zn-dependent dipeptidase